MPEPGYAVQGDPYQIVAIAASAGGIIALGRVLGDLPRAFADGRPIDEVARGVLRGEIQFC